jgi:hypothetical protein
VTETVDLNTATAGDDTQIIVTNTASHDLAPNASISNANDRTIKSMTFTVSGTDASQVTILGFPTTNYTLTHSGNVYTLTFTGSGALPKDSTWTTTLRNLTVTDTASTSHKSATITIEGFDSTGTQATNVVHANIICFYPGTLIATPDGARAVETLAAGDMVLDVDGAAKPIRWVGVQTVSTYFADPVRSLPIRIKAHALADNVPSRDLLVSPDHALLVDGRLIHAGALVNGLSVTRESNVPKVFKYFHIELQDHSLILAENTPAETFIDNVDRLAFDNWAEHEALDAGTEPMTELPYPRAKALRQVPVSIRVKLNARGLELYPEAAVSAA